ncbi:MAG TPA: DUF128 domain-containing protein [Candidatus Methanoperedenaceae archaeon]|nr:DUF128 domain-containing protein [Candidatus Methanoperedenaceae archaeon]
MITGTADPNVQRKLHEILRVISESKEAIGARVIADRLNERGYRIGERGVRYHLRILDERGLTERMGYEGRRLTETGMRELGNALVTDRLGFVSTHIEKLIYETTFDLASMRGTVVVNLSTVDKSDLDRAVEVMRRIAHSDFCESPYLRFIEEGSEEVSVPPGKISIATICSITLDGILLKSGIPVLAKYGGLIQMSGGEPVRFTDLIAYSGTSIDPMKIFLSRKMTSILDVVESGSGRVLGNVREIPSQAIEDTGAVLKSAQKAGLGLVSKIGEPGEPVLGAPVSAGKVGIAIYAGINMMAAVEESGIDVKNAPVSMTLQFKDMKKL